MTRPFIKWAGGKTQLLDKLRARMPATYGSYFEPMIGGGALFFNLCPQQAVICDLNGEAINAYRTVKDNCDELIASLGRHEITPEYYYELRNIDRVAGRLDQLSPIERASRFIYLNKMCFNGLYRVNKKGHFNVPIGSRRQRLLIDADNIAACSRALQNAALLECGYENIIGLVRPGDFVYFDPPYLPINETSNFTQYTKSDFGKEQHLALRDFCRVLNERGVHWLLSNSHCEYTVELYREFNCETIPALRIINAKGTRRGPVNELLVSNY